MHVTLTRQNARKNSNRLKIVLFTPYYYIHSKLYLVTSINYLNFAGCRCMFSPTCMHGGKEALQ